MPILFNVKDGIKKKIIDSFQKEIRELNKKKLAIIVELNSLHKEKKEFEEWYMEYENRRD